MMDIRRLEESLPVRGLGKPIHHYTSIGSTNAVAKELADQGSPHGTLVVADAQTEGRGRKGRKWHTEPGSGIAVSLILRPGTLPTAGNMLTALGAIAVVESLARRKVEAWIKWPNDVIVKTGKLAGVLVETAWQGDRLDYAILGIGVNVHAGSVPRVELDFPATYVEEATGFRIDREELLLDLVDELGRAYSMIDSMDFVRNWERHLAYLGEEVVLRGEAGEMMGTLEGLAADGRMRIVLGTGETVLAWMGDLSLRPIDSERD